jgi:hypothetical protein
LGTSFPSTLARRINPLGDEKEHDAKCRWQARTSEKAQLRKSYFRESPKGEVRRIYLPRTAVK